MKLIHSSSISIYNDLLKLNIKVKQVEEQLKYFFYLYKNGTLIEKKKGIEKPECSFKLYEDGTYFVRYIIKNIDGEDVVGKTENIEFEFPSQLLSQYQINYFGNSRLLDQLDMRRYLRIGKIVEGVSILDMSEDEMLSLCKSLTDNSPDSIIVDLIDQKDKYQIGPIPEELETKIRDQWVKFVKILRGLNQIRVILIERKSYTNNQDKKAIYDELNYFYEILSYPFYKYYHKISKVIVESQWIEKSPGEWTEVIKNIGKCKGELVKQLQWKDSPNFNIYSTRTENTIYIEARAELMNNELEYAFSLFKDRKLYEESGWRNEKSKQWEINENGIYFVRVYVRVKNSLFYRTKFSKTFGFFNEALQQEYKSFLNKEIMPTEIDKPLRYFKGEYPYNDFGLITIKEENQLKNGIEELQNFAKTNLEQNIHVLPSIGVYQNYLVSDITPMTHNEKQTILSGQCIIGDHYLCGTKDVQSIGVLEELCETTGQFSAIIAGKEDITITTGFFNISRLYYYQDSQCFIIANRYHMLILLCKYMGINLELNSKQVGVLLSSVDLGYGRENIMSDMNIYGLKEVKTGFYWKLTQDGWKQYQNSLYEVCNTKEVYHESKYKEMLVKAKEEMLNNLDAIFSDPRNEKILVDLSGGLDSRTVFSAVTNMIKNKEKIYISAGLGGNGEDIPISTAINELYHFPYNTNAVTLKYEPIESIMNKIRSADIGTYYNRPPKQTVQMPKITRLIGGFGEALYKPYWIRSMYNTQLEYSYNISDFVDILESLNIQYVNTDYDMAFSESQKLMEKELVQFPYEEVIEKFNYFSLAFGEVYHSHGIIKSYLWDETYMMLLSKQILKISSITQSVFKSFKMQMDFITECNPVLGVINYSSEANNIARDEIKDLYYSTPNLSGAVTLRTVGDTTDWKVAEAQRISNIKELREGAYVGNDALKQVIKDSVMYKFQKLMRQSEELSQMLGVALYYYFIYRDKNDRQIFQYYHKITSVIDQLSLIQ